MQTSHDEFDEIDEIDEEDTQKGKFLTFQLDKEVYGIEISFVKEIISIVPITSLPQSPAYVNGVISLRGSIIPVIDMRTRLHKQKIDYTGRTCIIILNIFETQIGFIVDGVAEVTEIKEENIVPPPDFKISTENRFLKGIGKVSEQVILVLNCEKLLTEQEFENLSETIA
jgi:purine-binding chemotaxis protein CheW